MSSMPYEGRSHPGHRLFSGVKANTSGSEVSTQKLDNWRKSRVQLLKSGAGTLPRSSLEQDMKQTRNKSQSGVQGQGGPGRPCGGRDHRPCWPADLRSQSQYRFTTMEKGPDVGRSPGAILADQSEIPGESHRKLTIRTTSRLVHIWPAEGGTRFIILYSGKVRSMSRSIRRAIEYDHETTSSCLWCKSNRRPKAGRAAGPHGVLPSRATDQGRRPGR